VAFSRGPSEQAGRLTLSVPSALLEQMRGPDGAAVNTLDWARELGNQLMGRVKNRLLSFDLRLTIGALTALDSPTLERQLQNGSSLRIYCARSLRGNIVVTLYGCLGAAGATQNAFNRVWAVPRDRRPNPIGSRLRSLLLLPVLGVGVLVTTALAGLTTGANAYGADVGTVFDVGAILLAVLTNIGLFLLAFRALTARQVPTRDLRVGAMAAGVGWQVVQLLGTYFVTHALRGTHEAYGVFGLVLGLIAWIYLLALVTVFAVEISVVAERRLWPRALLTPFTDRVQLTAADERAYAGYAGSERHKGFEVIDVGFDPPPESTVHQRSEDG